MKILFLIRSLALGGAEVQLAALAVGLRARGHEVRIAAFYAGGEVRKRLIGLGVRCDHLEKRSRWDLLAPLRHLIDLARAFQPEVIYSFMPAANVMSALLRWRLPRCALVWGVRSARVDWGFYGVAPKFLARLENWMSSRPDSIIFNSDAGRQYYIQSGWRNERMVVIRNGVDLEEFFPDAESGLKVRAELGVTRQIRVVGIVGRIDPIKDHSSFLRMAAVLLSKRSQFEFWFVGGDGDGSYIRMLQEYARDLGIAAAVRWLGVRDDMRAVYSAMDVTCLTSLAEGFPNVVAESMACGTPCVVFDVGDAAAIVNDPKLVVSNRNHEALAAAVLVALEEDAAQRRQQVRHRIGSEFSLLRSVERTESHLLDTINASAKSYGM